MSQFRTTIKIPKSEFDIAYSDNILLMGSCFSDNIGNKLSEHRFDTSINPFGIVFNPISLIKQLKLLNKVTSCDESSVFEHNNLWHSWQHHSSFSSKTKKELLDKIQRNLTLASDYLKQTNYLILTLGTAYAYRLKEKDMIVTNCHQYPNKAFTKELINHSQIVDEFNKILQTLKEQNPNLKIIFTISPIRHWKDGVVENQLSKANLILAVHELCNTFDWINYFPAYELVMDDLRDYRFYKADMLHPNRQAVDYIWGKFRQVYFDADTLKLNERIEKVNRDRNHRPRFPESEQHLAFLAKLDIEEKLIGEEIRVIRNS